jgi:hypothetical protein
MRVRQWLKNAFAVDPPGPAAPGERERIIIERLVGELVRRGLTVPALVLLESGRSLNFLAGQFLVFAAPIAELIFSPVDYRALHGFLERRGSIEYVCRRIELVAASQDSSRPAPGPGTRL